VREEIAAKERLGGLFIEDLSFPSVRDMRCGDNANSLTAEVKNFILRQRARWPVGKIVHGNLAAQLVVDHLRLRSGFEP
jgi:hypothetical protein